MSNVPSDNTYQNLRDQSRIPVASGQSSTDSTQSLPFLIDPITGRVLVDASGGASGTAVYGEVVSGSGTSWTLAHTPTAGTLRVYANGQRLTVTVDYSLAGAVITTVLSWAAGTVLADYIY